MRRPSGISIAVVVDASVGAEWFHPNGDADARAFLQLMRAGKAIGIVSPIFPFEVLNVAGRRWGYSAAQMNGIHARMRGPIAYRFPPAGVPWCRWIEAGLTAYDASYAALAEEFGIPLATYDRELLEVVPGALRPGDVVAAMS